MPLIEFSINTNQLFVNSEYATGMDADGSFTLSHTLRELPHEGTEFFIRHVFIHAGSHNNSAQRRKRPTIWVGVELPEMMDEITTRDDISKTIVSTRGDATPHLNDRGRLRFPITMHPVDGWHNVSGGSGYNVVDYSSNIVNRQKVVTNASQHYEHKGFHSCKIPLGKMRLDNHTIHMKLTPYSGDGDMVSETTFNTNQMIRISQMQVILEYI